MYEVLRGVIFIEVERMVEDFPGGTVGTHPLANAGDTGLISDLGRSHVPQSNRTCELQLLMPRF